MNPEFEIPRFGTDRSAKDISVQCEHCGGKHKTPKIARRLAECIKHLRSELNGKASFDPLAGRKW